MRWPGLWLLLLFVLTGCATGRTSRVDAPVPRGQVLSGQASWYGRPHHGRRTASGEIYDMNKMTAAHRTLPLGTRVLVTNRENGRTIEVRINDRGPGAVGEGVIPVTLKIVTSLSAD